MALTLAISLVDGSVVCGQKAKFLLTATNTSSSAATLTSLAVSGPPGVVLEQPNFITPNVALGQGNPTLGASASLSTVFTAVFDFPNTAGPAPYSLAGNPLGVSGMVAAFPPSNQVLLGAQGQLSDGSIGSSLLVVTVLAATAIFPVPQGGATLFSQGANANLIAAIA